MPEAVSRFGDRLAAAVRTAGTPAIVGLDPRPSLLPRELRERFGLGRRPEDATSERLAEAYHAFCVGTLDVVADLVPAVKVQSAFFEALGPKGFAVQQAVIRHAKRLGLIVILDAKRGDIGSTAEAYAEAALGATGPWQADAVTVSPYLGPDTLEPFLRHVRAGGKGVFVLVRTSNPGAATLQEAALSDGRTVAALVADWVQAWAEETRGVCGLGSVGAVVAGTAPEALQLLRRRMPNAWFLVPGYGAQGAGANDVVVAVRDDGLGALISSSRAILQGGLKAEHVGKPWQDGVRQATEQMVAELNDAARRAGRSW